MLAATSNSMAISASVIPSKYSRSTVIVCSAVSPRRRSSTPAQSRCRTTV